MLMSGVVIEKKFFFQKRVAVRETKMTHLVSIYVNKAATRPWFEAQPEKAKPQKGHIMSAPQGFNSSEKYELHSRKIT